MAAAEANDGGADSPLARAAAAVVEQDEEPLEIEDYTSASPFEQFIADVEVILTGWQLHEGAPVLVHRDQQSSVVMGEGCA